jgi:hypothetical protein
MSVFPNFSQINAGVQSVLDKRKGSTLRISSLNPFVRITSGASPGLTLYSNPNVALFGAAGVYGDSEHAGSVGMTLGLKPYGGGTDAPLRPSPIVTSLEVDEGAGNLSRKASFSITCFSKSQMDTLSQFFLEPGFSIFIEWGWNTAAAAGGLVKGLSGTSMAKFQSFQNTDKQREAGGNEYDNYLGFNTGGSLSVDGDKWIINVKCTGYTELPSYLFTSNNGATAEGEEDELISRPVYGETDIKNAESNLGLQRWMKCFNLLPGTRQTLYVKGLESDTEVTNVNNFINFDDEVAAAINDSTDGGPWFLGGNDKKQVNGEEVEFPEGTEIIKPQKFIKFGLLMKIFTAIGSEGYTLNGDDDKIISFKINTKKTVCSAFKNMFSLDSGKLFIPNENTPSMNLSKVSAAAPKISELVSVSDPIDNRVGETIMFPSSNTLNQPQENGAPAFTKGAYEWGYLHDLYVNLDFAKGIMDTKNFFVKDALYQLLNGMSSAVNGMWNFQLDEHAAGETTTELRVFEMNCNSNGTPPEPYKFKISGVDCIFIDASFDMDISGAKMNQIIGSRLNQSLNNDTSTIPKTLFNSGKKDIIKLFIKEAKKVVVKQTEDLDAMKEANLNMILGKLSFYPRVELTENTAVKPELYDSVYLGAFNDSAIFSSFKNKGGGLGDAATGALMPINFSFKIHGVSGIKRGDMFKVDGIPKIYQNRGFFQVLSVKHAVEGMLWTTEVTGGFRPKK